MLVVEEEVSKERKALVENGRVSPAGLGVSQSGFTMEVTYRTD